MTDGAGDGEGRRKIDATLKAKIALEALREQATGTELARRIRFIQPSRFELIW